MQPKTSGRCTARIDLPWRSSRARQTYTPALAVPLHIEELVRTVPSSKHGAIINGITCRRTGNLPTNVPPFVKPKVDRGKPSIVPLVQPKVTNDRVLNDTDINLNFGIIPTVRFGASWCPDDPFGANRIEKFSTGLFYVSNSKVFNPYSCFSILDASDKNEDAVLRTTLEIEDTSKPLEINIPIAQSGFWQCDLLFAEIEGDYVRTSGLRVFDFLVKDQLFSNYDTLQFTLNGTYAKHVLTFYNVPAADILSIRFIPIQGKRGPAINGLSCSLRQPLSRETVETVLVNRLLTASNNAKKCRSFLGDSLFINSGGPELCGVMARMDSWWYGQV